MRETIGRVNNETNSLLVALGITPERSKELGKLHFAASSNDDNTANLALAAWNNQNVTDKELLYSVFLLGRSSVMTDLDEIGLSDVNKVIQLMFKFEQLEGTQVQAAGGQ